MTNGNGPVLPYMKQLPQDYYAKKYVSPQPTASVTTPPTAYIPPEPVSGPTDPINEGGIWIGTTYPSSPGEGWMFFNKTDHTLHIYSSGTWVVT